MNDKDRVEQPASGGVIWFTVTGKLISRRFCVRADGKDQQEKIQYVKEQRSALVRGKEDQASQVWLRRTPSRRLASTAKHSIP